MRLRTRALGHAREFFSLSFFIYYISKLLSIYIGVRRAVFGGGVHRRVAEFRLGGGGADRQL